MRVLYPLLLFHKFLIRRTISFRPLRRHSGPKKNGGFDSSDYLNGQVYILKYYFLAVRSSPAHRTDKYLSYMSYAPLSGLGHFMHEIPVLD